MNRSMRTRLIVISVLFSVCAAIIVWRVQVSNRTQPRTVPNLQCEKAVDYLNQEGLTASLAEALQEARYGIKRAERPSLSGEQDAYSAANPAQQFCSYFTADGLQLGDSSHPDKSWRMELKLRSAGYGTRQLRVSAGQLKAAGNRIEYARSFVNDKVHSSIGNPQTAMTEWYVNREDGIEQGFTMEAAPGGRCAGERLRLEMALSGDLRAINSGDGQAIDLTRESGERVLRCEHLEVKDAQGRKLAAEIGAERGQVWVEVDDTAAVWPVTIDPTLTQQAYLKASNAGGLFGTAVAISGDTVVVAAPGESSKATGVNGNQNDPSASDAGAAYVFVRSGTMWSQQAYLKASNTDVGDLFGFSVAISGDTLVVGAVGESSNATGVNGNQSDNSCSQCGAAYVFVRSGTSWSQQAYLKASNTDINDFFGQSVAISGDTVVVGAAGHSGAAYVFVRSGTSWSQQAYVKASNTDANDHFGNSVAISGDTVVVGAVGESSNATGVNGNQIDNSADFAGAAYVFVRSGTSWSQQAYLKASNTDSFDLFGLSVAISGDAVVVGARDESSNATGVNGNQSNNSASWSGAAYVFVRAGTSWTQQAYLKASNTDAFDQFGSSVAISGDTVVVGASFEDSNATRVNGNQSDNSAPNSGAAYVFVRSGTNWSQQAYIKASNTDAFDQFGDSVAVSGDTVVVGASEESSNATGVNGNQSNNSASGSGAAYVFVVVPCTITCPTDQFVTTGPGATQCCAVVNFAPTADGDCGAVACSPASGTCFPVGTTTVTCGTVQDGPSCTFTVTVTDDTPPAITCPDVNAAAVASCPIAASVPVNFTASATDNCEVQSFVCNPPSGSTFPVGATTVTCMATDTSGNMASCSFTVNAFSFCLQDETNPGSVVLVNAQTGDFSFCCGGVIIASGRGTLTTRGCIGSIDSSKGDRQIHIQWDTSANNSAGEGTAYIQKRSNKVVCQITDKNMSNNTCQCSAAPPTNPKKPPNERVF